MTWHGQGGRSVRTDILSLRGRIWHGTEVIECLNAIVVQSLCDDAENMREKPKRQAASNIWQYPYIPICPAWQHPALRIGIPISIEGSFERFTLGYLHILRNLLISKDYIRACDLPVLIVIVSNFPVFHQPI